MHLDQKSGEVERAKVRGSVAKRRTKMVFFIPLFHFRKLKIKIIISGAIYV